MGKRDVLDIALKIIGVVLLKDAVVGTPSLVACIITCFTASDDYPFSPVAVLCSSILGLLFCFILGVIFVAYSELLARRLVKSDEKFNVSFGDLSEERAFAFAIKIVGVFCLARGIPRFCYDIWKYYHTPDGHVIVSDSNFLTSVVYLAVGIYLVAGGNQLVRIAYRKRKETT